MTKVLLLDADTEKYEQKQNQTLSGVEGLITRFDQIVGSGADVPATRYLNKSPDGQNSTGNSDLENYFEKISADQETDIRPPLQWMLEIIHASEFGRPLPEDFAFEFPSLYEPDQTELADIKTKEVAVDLQLIEANIVPAYVIAQKLKDAGWYNVPDEHISALEEAYEEPEMPEEPEEQELDAPEEEVEPVDPGGIE
jgi:phage-related protein (TIGR01555 family)